MILSMTGFGAAKVLVGSEELLIELRSVNHKYCDVRVRLPKELAACEAALVKFLKSNLSRGAIEVSVRRSAESVGLAVPRIDRTLLHSYQKLFEEVKQELGAACMLSAKEWVMLPGVLKLEEAQLNAEEAAAALQGALAEAFEQLLSMRKAEGELIFEDLSHRLSLVCAHAQKLKALTAAAVEEFRSRLEARLGELIAGTLEPQRLAQEVVIFADRTDVTEELTRLGAHCTQAEKLLHAREPAGRRLDFLLQEMGREVNTIGSKSQHSGISLLVIEMKAELERIREQVQNVE
jgi:uncharacterized protein (TIGR00255 family)